MNCCDLEKIASGAIDIIILFISYFCFFFQFAEALLRLGFPRVCVLDAGGMNTMRTTGLMSVVHV